MTASYCVCVCARARSCVKLFICVCLLVCKTIYMCVFAIFYFRLGALVFGSHVLFFFGAFTFVMFLIVFVR